MRGSRTCDFTVNETSIQNALFPGAVILTGQKNYILQHTQKNVAQTGYEGFSLQFNQLPCSSATNYYESSGL